MMRVIAGTARGKNLAALPGEDVTRPTINRVKEAMFSSVQFSVPGARVLDLFAGSGQLGIEALSRGAKRCFPGCFPRGNPDRAGQLQNGGRVCAEPGHPG